MRTRNVSEYMLVLALWLVYKLIRLFIHLNQTTTVLREAGWPRRNGPQPLRSSVGTNSIRNYLNTIDNSWEF